jgi:hypothetical protein
MSAARATRADRSLTEGCGPVGAIAARVIANDDIESGPILVDRHQAEPAVAADLDFEPRDSPHLAVFDVGEHALDQGMS